MNIRKHITNVRALQFFQVVRFGVLLLISIIFTKTNLGVGEIGVYETFLLIAGSVSFFWIGGMLQSLLSIFDNNKTFGDQEKTPVLFNIFFVLVVLSILSAIAVYFAQPIMADLFSISGNKIPYMKILFMYIIVSGPANLVEYIYLLKNKPLSIIIYGVIVFSLQLVCVAGPILLGYDLGYGLYGLVFINTIRCIWLAIVVYKHSIIKLSKAFLKEYAVITIPIVASLLLSGSAKYIDGFIISYKFDEATFAIFTYGARELPFIVLLIAAFGNALTPKFSKPENRKNALLELKNGTRKLMHYMFPASIIFVLGSKYFYPLLFNENFTESSLIFNIYILIVVTRFVFARVILIGSKDTKPIFYSSLFEIILNVSLSLILINYWGIAGVAVATVISYVLEKIFLVVVLRVKHNLRITDYLNLRTYLIYTILLVLSFTLSFFI